MSCAREFLAPAIAGDMVALHRRVRAGRRLRCGLRIKTRARKDGDDYVINGSKMWITNSLQADWMCLLANTSDGRRAQNKSLIIVPMDTKGCQVGAKDSQNRHERFGHRPDLLR